jgi:murein DD-endopeptidase MepM/ murein hydrolase activator NlpD
MNSTDLKLLLGELFLTPTNGRFTSAFGYRADPFTGKRSLHNGIDLANSIGTPIRAALAGKVVAVTNLGGYGKMIMIQHERGFRTLYGHLNAFNVQLGQYVSQGQIIARMGNTGRSTGPHLHFSVILNGVFVKRKKVNAG